MNQKRQPFFTSLLMGMLLLFSGAASAMDGDFVKEFGDYVVHFNAFPSEVLPASVTQQYGLTRSKNQGVMNITVLKKVMGTAGSATRADVSGTMANLMGQKTELDFKEIDEGNAVYYITQFEIVGEEQFNFDIVIQPAGSDETYTLEFFKRFRI